MTLLPRNPAISQKCVTSTNPEQDAWGWKRYGGVQPGAGLQPGAGVEGGGQPGGGAAQLPGRGPRQGAGGETASLPGYQTYLSSHKLSDVVKFQVDGMWDRPSLSKSLGEAGRERGAGNRAWGGGGAAAALACYNAGLRKLPTQVNLLMISLFTAVNSSGAVKLKY